MDPALAWGGVKDSGRGVSLSKFGACQALMGTLFSYDVLNHRLRSTHTSKVGEYEDQYIVNRLCTLVKSW